MNYINYRSNILLIAIALLLFTCYCHGAQRLSPRFLAAIHMAETSGRVGAIKGDNGKALGPFQIHYSYWRDSGVKGNYSQCADYNYSLQVVTAYLNRYGAEFIKRNDYKSLARLHNGGPKGYLNPRTNNYWNRVRNFLT